MVFDLADKVQQLLGAAHREGGDHHIAALAQRFVNDFRQLVGVGPHLGVVAAAVSTLHDHIVGVAEKLRIADNGLIHIADVAGKYDGAGLAVFRQLQTDAGAAQQVTGVDKRRLHAVAQRDLLPVLAGGHKLVHTHGIGHGVERLLQGTACALVLTVFILGVTFLNVCRILQHNVQQLRRQTGG